jgi:hypothetical protein
METINEVQFLKIFAVLASLIELSIAGYVFISGTNIFKDIGLLLLIAFIVFPVFPAIMYTQKEWYKRLGKVP